MGTWGWGQRPQQAAPTVSLFSPLASSLKEPQVKSGPCQCSPGTHRAVSVPNHPTGPHPRDQGSMGKNVFLTSISLIPFLSLNFFIELWMLLCCLGGEAPRCNFFLPHNFLSFPQAGLGTVQLQSQCKHQKLAASWHDSLASHFPASDISWLKNEF